LRLAQPKYQRSRANQKGAYSTKQPELKVFGTSFTRDETFNAEDIMKVSSKKGLTLLE
jgi:hypothetical protein